MLLNQTQLKPELSVSGFFIIIVFIYLFAIEHEGVAASFLGGAITKVNSEVFISEDKGLTGFPSAMLHGTSRYLPAIQTDTLSKNVISASYSYDLLYHKRSNKENVDVCARTLQTDIVLKRGTHFFVNGINYKAHNLDFPEPTIGLDVNSDLLSLRIHTGYIRDVGMFTVGAMAASDIVALEKLLKPDQANRLSHVYSTSVLDFQGYIALVRQYFSACYTYDNSSILTGKVTITGNENGNKREVLLDINRDRSQIDIGYSLKNVKLGVHADIETYTSNPIVGTSQLSLGAQGWGGRGGAFIQYKTLPYTPMVSIAAGIKALDMSAIESAKNKFAYIDNSTVIDMQVALDINLSIKNTLGLIYKSIESRNGEGLLEIYPFTSWPLLVNIPDKIKISNLNTHMNTTGVSGVSEITFRGMKLCSINYGMEYCEVVLRCNTKDLVLVGGIFPDYRNEKVYSEQKDFILLTIGVEQRITNKLFETIVRLRQAVPFELNGTTGRTEKNEAKKADRKTRIFGGFRCDVGFAFKW